MFTLDIALGHSIANQTVDADTTLGDYCRELVTPEQGDYYYRKAEVGYNSYVAWELETHPEDGGQPEIENIVAIQLFETYISGSGCCWTGLDPRGRAASYLLDHMWVEGYICFLYTLTSEARYGPNPFGCIFDRNGEPTYYPTPLVGNRFAYLDVAECY